MSMFSDVAHRPRRSGRGALSTAVSLTAVAALIATASGTVSAQTAGTATVVVNIGGIGGEDSPGALDGVVLGLFENKDDMEPVVECTSEGGTCTFTVDGAAGQSYWVKGVEVPDGWFANPSLRTGEGTGTDSQENDYVFQTPPVEPGGAYTSGTDFMNDEGGLDRDASGGHWQVSRDNVPLPQRCGLDVGLLLDTSGSLGEEIEELKRAADTITDALVGTPSRMAVFSFSSISPATLGDNHPALVPVATPGQAAEFKERYQDWGADGGTNWDHALDTVVEADDHYDLVLMVTDGNPTFHRDQRGPGSFTRFREMEEAIFSANRLKEQGTRLVVAGVGDGIDTETELNLRAITGPTGYDGDNLLEADYLHTDDFAAVGEDIREMIDRMCAGSLSVTKMIVPEGNGDGDLTGAAPAGPGWTFTAGTETDGAGIDPGEATTTDDGTGTVNFALIYSTDTDSVIVNVTEQQQDGHRLVLQDGEAAVCWEHGEGGEQDFLPVDTVSEDGDDPAFTVAVRASAAVSCTVHNQREPGPEADLTVDKSWWIDGAVYAEGEQPDGFEAALGLVDADGPVPQEWGAARTGYTVGDSVIGQEVMTAPNGCSLVSAQARPEGTENPFDGLEPGAEGTPGEEYREDFEFALTAEHNRYTVYNAFSCDTRLTLVKEVDNTGGGTASPQDWTLTATGPDGGSISGASGDPAVTGAAVMPGDHELNEGAGPDWYTAGAWSCRAEGSTEELADIDVVTVPLGDHVVCEVLNTFKPRPSPRPKEKETPDPEDPSPSPRPKEKTPDPEDPGQEETPGRSEPGPRASVPDRSPEQGGLPVTGASVAGAAGAALLLITAGVLSLVLVRRRSQTEE